MKTIFAALMLIVGMIIPELTLAQKTPQGAAFNGGVGLSLLGILSSLSFVVPDETSFNFKSSPCFAGSMDFGVGKSFSIGFGGGYQQMSNTIEDYAYTDANQNVVLGEYTANLTRINAGVRLLFRFGNKKIDAYMGLKPGINIYLFNADAAMPVSSPTNLSITRFAFQYIPFGMRCYLTDDIGLFFETGIGAPSFLSGGICIDFKRQESR